MTWRVPVADLALTEGDIEAFAACLDAGLLRPGARVDALEEAVATFTGASHAVAVASGSAALHLACHAVSLGPGDEVIVPALTFLASAAAPRYVGARVVLCDVVSPTEPNIDPADVERRITPRTKAVVAVHLWGYPAQVGELRRLCDAHGLALIEDAAQAIGAAPEDADGMAGTIGDAGCLSFFSKKQLAVGEGGMVLTRDPKLAARCRRLRSLRFDEPTVLGPALLDLHDVGYAYELDEPRAALGLSRLERLEADIAHRRATVERYRERFRSAPRVRVMFEDAPLESASHFAFGLQFDSVALRESVSEALAQEGVQTTRYPVLHELTEYRAFAPRGSLPNAEEAAAHHLVLPLSSHIASEDVDLVADAVLRAVESVPGSVAPV